MNNEIYDDNNIQNNIGYNNIQNNIENNNIQNNIGNNNNQNIRRNNQNNRGNKIIVSVILLIATLILSYNVYNLFYIVNLIKKAYITLPPIVFEECFLYQRFSDLFIEFLSFFLGIDLILLTFIPFIEYNFNLDDFIIKYAESFIYFNYLVFGPFSLFSIIMSLSYKHKIMYICLNFNPQNKIIDYRLSLILLFIITISLVISFLGSFYFEHNYFSNSIKYKSSGNYIIGNLFWAYALSHSRHFRNVLNQNNLNEEILNNENNNQDENQNLI